MNPSHAERVGKKMGSGFRFLVYTGGLVMSNE